MNFTGKNSGDSSGRRQQQQHGGDGGGGGNSFDEEDEEERQNTGPQGQLFTSSPSFHPQLPYHHHRHPPPRGGWIHGGDHQPSSSRLTDPMMVDYTSSVAATASATDGNINHGIDENNVDAGEREATMMVVEREHMFDKVVTPSDVGKLNRLVIPKQHAERYFPLDSSSNDKGLLLNFEDRNGKPWRFRYSYWNSSQSYVMTKGWSRFVKDKKLDAGDIVSFQRGVGGSAKDRLFIDWRHRPDAPAPPYHLSSLNPSFPHQFSFNRNNWNPLFLQSQPAIPPPSRTHYSNLMLNPSSYRYGGPYHTAGSGSVIYYRSGGTGGIGMDPPSLPLPPPLPPPPPSGIVFESVPVVHGKAAGKRLRLFGVNMDCPVNDDNDNNDDGQDDYNPNPTMVSSTSLNDPISMANYHHQYHHHHLHHQPLQEFLPETTTLFASSSSSTIPYLQLRPYEEDETQFHQTTIMSSSSTDALSKTTKSSSSRMTLDLDI